MDEAGSGARTIPRKFVINDDYNNDVYAPGTRIKPTISRTSELSLAQTDGQAGEGRVATATSPRHVRRDPPPRQTGREASPPGGSEFTGPQPPL